MAFVLDGHLVMTVQLPVTMHDDQGSVYKDRSTHKATMAARPTFYLDRLNVDDWFFASLVCRMLRRAFSENWRKQTQKSKVFCGVVAIGLDGHCSVQAEQRKKPVAVGPLPDAYLSTETTLVLIRGITRKEFDTGHTHIHTRTHTHAIEVTWWSTTVHMTLGKNKKVVWQE